MSVGLKSPTVLKSYSEDPDWFKKLCDDGEKYDIEGYDLNGYDYNGVDRAGNDIDDYVANETRYLKVLKEWNEKPSLLEQLS